MPRTYTRLPVADRFWNKVYFDTTEHGCWWWTAGCFDVGYGMLKWFSEETGKWTSRGAHRISWELHGGVIPNGLFVLHSCDNRPCVNPAHLWLGTPRDNHHDAMAKGRHARGETNGNARLMLVEVIEIRKRYDAGGVSQQTLADEHGVARTTVGWIVRGEHWKEALGEAVPGSV